MPFANIPQSVSGQGMKMPGPGHLKNKNIIAQSILE